MCIQTVQIMSARPAKLATGTAGIEIESSSILPPYFSYDGLPTWVDGLEEVVDRRGIDSAPTQRDRIARSFPKLLNLFY